MRKNPKNRSRYSCLGVMSFQEKKEGEDDFCNKVTKEGDVVVFNWLN